jgi:hypothetical protein
METISREGANLTWLRLNRSHLQLALLVYASHSIRMSLQLVGDLIYRWKAHFVQGTRPYQNRKAGSLEREQSTGASMSG